MVSGTACRAVMPANGWDTTVALNECFEALMKTRILPGVMRWLAASFAFLIWPLLPITPNEATAGVRPVHEIHAEKQIPDAGQESALPKGTEENVEKLVRHGPFLLAVEKEPGGDRFKVEVRKDGKVLYRDQSYYSTPPVDVIEGLPHKGCSTLVTYCFSGGAHCCTTAILCTTCGQEESMTVFDLSNLTELILSERGPDEPPEVSLLDYQFAYYHSRNSSFWFPFSQSPAMERLLVYRNGSWRVDRPGEDRHFYERLMARDGCPGKAGGGHSLVGEDEAVEMAASAIECTYYALMAGQSAESATGILKSRLPRSWQSELVGLYQDTKRAAADFNAIKKSYRSQGR